MSETDPERPPAVRVATSEDLGAAGQLLHDFNVEYEDPAPPPRWLAQRLTQLMADGQTVVLLGGDGPDGLAVLRFRPSLWTDALECYLAELYVAPAQRGHGIGRALMNAAMTLARQRGADRMELGTGEEDRVARALYESLGFINRERPDGPIAYVYEREL